MSPWNCYRNLSKSTMQSAGLILFKWHLRLPLNMLVCVTLVDIPPWINTPRLGGPHIDMKYGRVDVESPSECAPDGNLPGMGGPAVASIDIAHGSLLIVSHCGRCHGPLYTRRHCSLPFTQGEYNLMSESAAGDIALMGHGAGVLSYGLWRSRDRCSERGAHPGEGLPRQERIGKGSKPDYTFGPLYHSVAFRESCDDVM